MDRYARRSLGLVALFALGISVAHTVWALCCIGAAAPSAVGMASAEAGPGRAAPAMQMVSHHIAVIDAGSQPATATHPNPPHGSLPSGLPDECPHGQSGVMGGCAVAAAIPVGTTVVAAIPLGNHDPISISDTLPRVLLGTDLFRPPRA